MNYEEQAGYDLTKGATHYLGILFLVGFAIIITFALGRNALGIGLDSSDKDGWNRSGLTVHTDYKTGIQYLSDGHGGLIQRVK